MSDSDRTKEILKLCDEALAMEPKERKLFLQKCAETDRDLETSVRQLLQAVEDSGSFMVIEELPDDVEST